MANFIFDWAKVSMATGDGLFSWTEGDVIGILYDNRVVVQPTMDWTDLESFEVARSASMTGRAVSSTGIMLGDTLEFLNVTTGPGLRIRGLLLAFDPTMDLILNVTDGLDGFSGNNDLNLEALDLDIYARTSAANNSSWIAL